MRRLLTLALTLMSLSLPVLAQSQRELIAFIALRMGNKMQTNGDIHDFLVASKMTDEQKQELFKQAQGNFNQYKNLERKWAQARFDLGLRQVAYFELAKSHHLRSLERKQSRQYFNTTEREYFDRVQEEESRVLKHLLDQRLGIVKSREIFGNWLIEQNYPHDKTKDSATDVYFRWYDAMKARLKAEYQMKELQEYEIAMAVKKNYNNLEPRPTEIWDIGKNSNALIDQHLEGKSLSQQEIDALSLANPEMLVMVKDIKFISLTGTKTIDLENNENGSDALEAARSELEKSLNQKGRDGILKYIGIANQLREKYKQAEKLEELAESALERFMQNGNFNDFMLGKLYKLAAKLESTSQANALTSRMAATIDVALNAAVNFQVSDRNFEESVYHATFDNLASSNDLEIEVASLLSWVVKFEAKKIALKTPASMMIERYDYKTFEGQKRIRDYVKMNKIQNGLKRFREEDIRDASWMIELTTGNGFFSGDRAFNYLMERN